MSGDKVDNMDLVFSDISHLTDKLEWLNEKTYDIENDIKNINTRLDRQRDALIQLHSKIDENANKINELETSQQLDDLFEEVSNQQLETKQQPAREGGKNPFSLGGLLENISKIGLIIAGFVVFVLSGGNMIL